MNLLRPEISFAVVASIFLGATLAAATGPISWLWLGLTAVGAWLFEMSNNATRRFFRDKGLGEPLEEAEREPSRGAAALAAALFALAATTGFVIVTYREPGVIWFGGVGAFITYFYHAPPMQLSWRGLGPLAAAIAYGPLLVGGTYLIQTGDLSSTPGLAAVPLGLLVGAYVLVSEFSSVVAERRSGRHTLAYRLGHRRASYLFAGTLGLAFVTAGVLPLLSSDVDRGVWMGLLGIPPAILAARALPAHPDDATEITHVQAWTLLAFLLYAVGAGFGALLF